MASIIPYHETSQFVRLVSLFRPKSTEDAKWNFLSSCVRSQMPLDRTSLVQQMVKQPELVQVLCCWMRRFHKERQLFSTWTSFFTVTIISYLKAIKSIQESHLLLIMPTVVEGIQSEEDAEYQLSSLMILSVVSVRSLLPQRTVDALMTSVARHHLPALSDQSFKTLAHLYATQSHHASVPLELSDDFFHAIKGMENVARMVHALLCSAEKLHCAFGGKTILFLVKSKNWSLVRSILFEFSLCMNDVVVEVVGNALITSALQYLSSPPSNHVTDNNLSALSNSTSSENNAGNIFAELYRKYPALDVVLSQLPVVVLSAALKALSLDDEVVILLSHPVASIRDVGIQKLLASHDTLPAHGDQKLDASVLRLFSTTQELWMDPKRVIAALKNPLILLPPLSELVLQGNLHCVDFHVQLDRHLDHWDMGVGRFIMKFPKVICARLPLLPGIFHVKDCVRGVEDALDFISENARNAWNAAGTRDGIFKWLESDEVGVSELASNILSRLIAGPMEQEDRLLLCCEWLARQKVPGDALKRQIVAVQPQPVSWMVADLDGDGAVVAAGYSDWIRKVYVRCLSHSKLHPLLSILFQRHIQQPIDFLLHWLSPLLSCRESEKLLDVKLVEASMALLSTFLDSTVDYQMLLPVIISCMAHPDAQVRSIMHRHVLPHIKVERVAAAVDGGEKGAPKKSAAVVYGQSSFYGHNTSTNLLYLTTSQSRHFSKFLRSRAAECVLDEKNVGGLLDAYGKEEAFFYLSSHVIASPVVRPGLLKVLESSQSHLPWCALYPLLLWDERVTPARDDACDFISKSLIVSCLRKSPSLDFTANHHTTSHPLTMLQVVASVLSTPSHAILENLLLKLPDFFPTQTAASQTELIGKVMSLLVVDSTEDRFEAFEGGRRGFVVGRILPLLTLDAKSLLPLLRTLLLSDEMMEKRTSSVEALLLILMHSQVANVSTLTTHLYNLIPRLYLPESTLSCSLVLQELVAFLTRMDHAAIDDAEDIRCDLLVQLLRTTHLSALHSSILTLLMEVARSHPALILRHLMPIFTFMGSTSAVSDDVYTQSIVRRVIDTLIPLVLTCQSVERAGGAASMMSDEYATPKETAEDSDGSNPSEDRLQLMRIEILQIFIRALPHMPQHRRLLTFHPLLVQLKPSNVLAPFLILIHAETALPKDGHGFDYEELLDSLLPLFDAEDVLHALVLFLKHSSFHPTIHTRLIDSRIVASDSPIVASDSLMMDSNVQMDSEIIKKLPIKILAVHPHFAIQLAERWMGSGAFLDALSPAKAGEKVADLLAEMILLLVTWMVEMRAGEKRTRAMAVEDLESLSRAGLSRLVKNAVRHLPKASFLTTFHCLFGHHDPQVLFTLKNVY